MPVFVYFGRWLSSSQQQVECCLIKGALPVEYPVVGSVVERVFGEVGAVRSGTVRH